jgi:tetratricopeptide (TPR) repeat protein
MRWKVAALLFAALAASAAAQVTSLIEEADAALDADNNRQTVRILERALDRTDNSRDRAEVLWRLSRVHLIIGDALRERDAPQDEVLSTYETGEQYGQQAIEADPRNHLGYYWKASNVGRWGQTRGVLNSLFRAGEVRDLLAEAIRQEPDHGDSYYVLGQVYAKVPGLISFGNIEYAVSLARKSVDLHEEARASQSEEEPEYDFYIQLASHLKERGWSEGKRRREEDRLRREYRQAGDVLERSFRYEGTVELPRMSDREEARRLLTRTIRRMENADELRPDHRRNLEDAREMLAEL